LIYYISHNNESIYAYVTLLFLNFLYKLLMFDNKFMIENHFIIILKHIRYNFKSNINKFNQRKTIFYTEVNCQIILI
jgi:hypothetical protein